MAMLTTNANRAFLPEDIGNLVVRPVERASVAVTVSTFISTPGHKFRVPIVAADAAAAWTPEGTEITPADAVLAEDEVTFDKLAGLTIISRELADDTSPAAADVVGNSIARDIAKKLDAAYFAATTVNGPDGIGSITANTINAGPAWTDIDAFTQAIYDAEDVGATLSGFVANKADALILAQLKELDNSNKPLLQPDPTMPTRRTINGVPLHVSPAVAAGTVWGIPGNGLALVVMRQNVTLDIDRSAYFSSDRVGVRATLRVGFSFPHPAAVQKITLTPPPASSRSPRSS